MTRDAMYRRLEDHRGTWDLVVIGGGATGAGIAIDAATRGYSVLLLEQSDFGKGTSSRSTKLIHGGVRYLEQGNISLVMESLKERGLLVQNAPHLVQNLGFVVPNYEWWEAPFYGLGLKLYNLLAGKYGFGPSRILTKEETMARLPTLRSAGLRGGVIYYDGQFDDARLLVNLMQTAYEHGATVLNHVRVAAITSDAQGFVNGVVAHDSEAGAEIVARANVVVNAAGPFSDSVRRLADDQAQPMLAPSQGIHLVFDRSFLPGEDAILVPHTSDGRVMFAIPWRGHTLVGTTDTPVADVALEPAAMDQEVEFVLKTASQYLRREPSRSDILSVFAGIRPLVRSQHIGNTASLSRDHTIHIDRNGLLTICGGKWTTYRRMAEDCVNQAATLGQLPERPCRTHNLKIHGFHIGQESEHLRLYGTDAANIRFMQSADTRLAERLDEDLPYTAAEVLWAVRHEMARTIEDVLARRLRALFLNAAAACRMAPRVAALMAKELGQDEAWQAKQLAEFQRTAVLYMARTSIVH